MSTKKRKIFIIHNEWIQKHGFVLCVIFLCLIKQMMVSCLPVFARDAGGPDQYKLLIDAEALFSGKYLENNAYDIFTLFKRAISFPIFLALCHELGISYLAGYTFYYSMSCVLFLFALMQISNKKLPNLIAFAFLLFSPYTYGYSVQMIYNLSFTAPLAIGGISCLLLAFFKRNTSMKVMIFWVFLASLQMVGIWLNREDSVWIIPLLLIFLLVGVITSWKDKKAYGRKRTWMAIFIYAIPLLCIPIGDACLSYVNYCKYGIFTTNDYTSTNFERAYNDLLKIDPKSFPDYCSITREMLEEGYKYSPSLQEIKQYMDEFYELGSYDISGLNPNDGEIEDSLMNIALRDAASRCGYYKNAIETDEYWGRVANELEGSFEKGQIETRNIFFFGSTLHHPWNKNQGYLGRWVKSFAELFNSVVHHEVFATPVLVYNETSEAFSDRYESMTLNYTVNKPINNIAIAGWILPYSGTEISSIYLLDENMDIISEMPLIDSPDIYLAYLNNEAAKKCRFDFTYSSVKKPSYIKVVMANQQEILPLDSCAGIVNEIEYYLDCFEVDVLVDSDEHYALKKVGAAKKVADIYQYITPIGIALFFILYIYKGIYLLMGFKNKAFHYFEQWLIQSTFLGCALIMLIAISYVHAFMWGALFYTHTIGVLVDTLVATSIALDYKMIFDVFAVLYKKHLLKK